MSNSEIFVMSSQELTRKEILDRVINREIKQVKAAKMLGITDRWLRILLVRYKTHGAKALVSKKRGHVSNRAKPKELKEKSLELVKTKYHDFGPTFAAEKLAERDNLTINHETLRLWMIKAELHSPRHQKKTHIHQSRERRECFGELIQIDGSHHDWFEGRADKCCLIVFIDDATSSLMYCRFEEAETTQGYFRSVKDYINYYGLPEAFYSDRFGVFRVNQECSDSNGTQFKRAMDELGIQLICANSPQAKGKVERANSTLQSRLIKEMRLRNINNIEEANKYLPEFIEKYNKKFAKPAKSSVDSHVQCNTDTEKVDYILSVRETRKLSKNLECSFNNTLYQVVTDNRKRRLRYAKVNIATNTNGDIAVWHNNEKLRFKTIKKVVRTDVANSKTLPKMLKSGKKYKPAADHPWRQKNQNNSLKVSQIKRNSLTGEKPDLSNLR